MGLEPKDYDIATAATPEEVIALFDRSIPVGIQFGVVRVLIGGEELEVATFRADGAYTDGRRPDGVTWSSAREDVLRRDFTINALLSDPLDGERVVDHVGGLADIDAGVVRAVGDADARFAEDRLRMLRAVRFAARFDFSIDPATWRAVQRHASEIGVVSVERIFNELDRMLTEGGAHRSLGLLATAGLLAPVLPELQDWERARERFDDSAQLASVVAWSALLYDLPDMPTAGEAWGLRLKTSRQLARGVGRAVVAARSLAEYETLGVAARKRLLRSEHAAAALTVASMVAATSQSDGRGLAEAGRDLSRWDPAALAPDALLTGADLRALGFTPGPAFGEVLVAVEDAQLEGRIDDRDAALALATRLLATRLLSG